MVVTASSGEFRFMLNILMLLFLHFVVGVFLKHKLGVLKNCRKRQGLKSLLNINTKR